MPNDAKQQIIDATVLLGANPDFWPQKDRVRAQELQATEVKFWNNSGAIGASALRWPREVA